MNVAVSITDTFSLNEFTLQRKVSSWLSVSQVGPTEV